ncbi:alpha-L-rhamnosidase C-terminal domain-containing protein [Cohnella sp. GCM10027633]|uniref:alpha-L-rhamnosidase-related protein n=1 Tax=unclassified Cohnella TaxID=2636738 RepID=UPI003628FF58
MEELREWSGKWIWPDRNAAGMGDAEQERVLFRRAFRVQDAKAAKLTVDVSADSRYRMYANGKLVGRGPCKGDAWSQYYDTIDLTPYLIDGDNVLAAEVVHYPVVLNGNRSGVGGPASEWRSDRGGLWLEGALTEGDNGRSERLDTDESWRMLPVSAAIRLQREHLTLFTGGTEDVAGEALPRGWREADFDDSSWLQPKPAEPLDRLYGGLTPWQLAPRPIPPMRETERAFGRVMRGSFAGVTVDASSVFPLRISPGEEIWLELDAGLLTTGYPQLAVAGGTGGRVNLLYSESYEYENRDSHGGSRRGVRDDPEGKALIGNDDTYAPAGWGTLAEPETYEPMNRRAFRFVRLSAQAGREPLVIVGLTYLETGYPLDVATKVETSDPLAPSMWDISLNTLRRCMQDTYEDTPYYEQMQYIMDAKSQAMFTYAVSADDRLPRKTIHDFHSSLAPSGLLQSRYPSVSRQIIPGFALFWIMMVHDHYRHFADVSLAKRYLPTADAVLGWFDRRIDGSGLVGVMPEAYWSFVDWVEEWRAQAGSPPAKWQGPMTVYNLMYAAALRQASELNARCGRADTAAEYAERASAIVETVNRLCFDPEAGLYRDGPGVRQFSQHAQLWAVLGGAAEGEAGKRLLENMLSRKELPKASFSMSHFLFRALAKVGLYDRTAELWAPWKEQIGLNLTAWVEDPVQQRSDCHGWGALPLYEYTAETLGVQPEEPGYAAIRIAPKLAGLTWARGEAATPRGIVKVEWRVEGEGAAARFELRAEAPAGVPVVVELPDGSRHEPAERSFRLACSI